MKYAILIALTLVSISAFAKSKVSKGARKAAIASCKSEGKTTKKELKACVKEKTVM